MLPYASDFLTDLAASAIDGACFSSNVTDQFLTMVAQDNMADYEGDSDFGSLTRIDLDDELRVVLVLLDITTEEHHVAYRDEALDNLRRYYAASDVLLGEGGDQKWWADWSAVSTEEADETQAAFSEEYSRFLGCEDCNMPTDECVCDFDETAGPIPPGTHIKVNTFSGVALTVRSYRPDGRMIVRMVGDDRDWDVDPTDAMPLDDDEFCTECGQIGCAHDGR